MTKIKNALISVSNKDGLDKLVAALQQFGVQLYSTGGTASYIREQCKAECHSVESITEFPELMEGRVKTLHPKIFGGILARRSVASDLEQAKEAGIVLLDLVIVNLYPFSEYLGQPDNLQAAYVDIGGPSLLRAAAKNHESVTVVCDPRHYEGLINELHEGQGKTSAAFRKKMAAQVFTHTSTYDALIASEWSKEESLPSALSLAPQSELRYGENPHQKAAWTGTPSWEVLQGKALSYNNLLDAEAAFRIVQDFEAPGVSVVKHNNPCGVAIGNDPLVKVFQNALACDSQSAFGGIVACNREIDGEAARAMTELFLEVIIATGFTEEARSVFGKKKNLRLIEWKTECKTPISNKVEVRAAMGGWLVQQSDQSGKDSSAFKTVTKLSPSEAVNDSLRFAWLVAKHVRSNAIVLARDNATIGIGAGQMSRVDAVELALSKCGGETQGAVLASDAFFPFRDNIDLLKGKGIAAIIQPGGSIRDKEVIEACNEHQIAMVFTAERHFRH